MTERETPLDRPDTRPLVVLDSPEMSHLIARLAPEFEVVSLWDDPAGLLARRAADIRIAFGGGASARLPAEVMAALPNLGLIARIGSGYDGVDVAYARRRGIPITNTPGVNASDVADYAVGLLIALVRRIPQADDQVRGGRWRGEADGPPTRSLTGLRVGIVGLGAIGRAVARRLDVFGCDLAWWGPRPKADAPWPRADSLLRLADGSDALVVCARADHSNRRLLDGEIPDALGPDGVLVNVSRGGILDEDGLIARLRSGGLAGAGLDVFAAEPSPPRRWRDVPNVILSPHVAGHTRRSADGLIEGALANMRAFLRGDPLPNPI